MTEFGTLIFALGALSLTVTKTVDLIRNAADKNDRAPRWVWSVAPLVIGVAYCWGWSINLAESAVRLVPAIEQGGVPSALTGVAGSILTGLAAGAGAGGFHEVLDALSSRANVNNVNAGATVFAEDVVTAAENGGR